MITEIERECWTPQSVDEKSAVADELARVLVHPSFSQSKRYPQFLRFVVAHVLSTPTEPLKERVLGHEIFGKTPDYDTASDPVVRVTAAEIRKRLVQYYSTAAPDSEIRIVLPLGSYSPRFYLAPELEIEKEAVEPFIAEPAHPATQDEALAGFATQEVPKLGVGRDGKSIRPSTKFTALAIATGLAVTGLLLGFFIVRRSDQRVQPHAFWAPVLHGVTPLVLCIPDKLSVSALPLGDAKNPEKSNVVKVSRTEAAMSDLTPLINVVEVMERNNRTFRIVGSTGTSLDKLREGPAVLIGSYSNPWTLRLTERMRLHFANDPEMTKLWIEDRANPTLRKWARDVPARTTNASYEDFGLVARFLDPDTGQYVVVAAGLGHGGTLAAGELLTSSERLNALMQMAPKGWAGQNVEVVVKTIVVHDQAGAPHIVATHFW